MNAGRYRKKPVVIDAWEFAEGCTVEGAEELAKWCGGTLVRSDNLDPPYIDIPTIEGTMRAQVGDWIIRGVKSEFYPCKPDIFAATYEPDETDGG